jgi:hypothetical protein
MISTNFVAELEEQLEQRRAEVEMIRDQLQLYDVRIDQYDAIIENMDRSILPLVDEINVAISSVKTAYDNRISNGCKTDLIWVLTASNTYQVGLTSSYSTYTYTARKNSAVQIDYNKYGVKYYRRPQNQDYGSNIVAEFTGSAGYGATNLAVTSIGGTNSLLLGDTITDSIDNPQLYSAANLPDIVGFGVSLITINSVEFGGTVSFGSTIIVHTGIGSTVGINTGDSIEKVGVLSPGTTVVGFSTGSYTIEVWDYATGAFISSSTSGPALVVSSPATGAATTVFTVGIKSEFPSLLLDQPINANANDAFFTAIRTTQSVLDNFDYTNNPLDPVTIAIMDTTRVGLGHTAILVNNGSSPGPFQWEEVIGPEFSPEPACGNGYVTYYSGTTQWPGYITYTYNTSGVAIASTFTYATEGQSITVTTAGIGTTTSTPSRYSINYSGTSPTNPGLTGCSTLDTAITSAESSRDAIIARNQPIITDILNKARVLRTLRDKLEGEAFAMLQGKVYSEVEINKLTSDIATLNNIDLTPFEPTTYRNANRFSSNTTGVATS